MTNPWLADELRDWGLDVVEVTGWQDRKRPGAFDPLGVLIHHTAAPGPKDAPSLQVCIEGRRDLPGPLCQLLVARSGKVYVIAAGRCNHAGAGQPIGDVTDGNRQLVGIEAENDGVGEPWPIYQQWAMAQAATAVCYRLNPSRITVLGHKEWAPGRKIDPSFDMNQFRARVSKAWVDRPKETTVPTPPTSPNPYPKETAEALDLLAEHAGYTDPDRKWFGPNALAALHRLKNAWVDAEDQVRTMQSEAKALITERDTAIANREAAEAEALDLRRQIQEGSNRPAVQAIVQELRATLNDIDTRLQGLA